MSSTDQATQLERTLGADEASVEIEGLNGDRQTIVVRPLKIRQLACLLRCINELANAGVDVTNLNQIDYGALLMEGGDVAINFVAELITTEPDPLKRSQAVKDNAVLVGNQNALDGSNLLSAVYQVNKSFFESNGDRLLEGFGLTAEQIAKVKAEISGAISSLFSSAPDTVSPTSVITPSAN